MSCVCGHDELLHRDEAPLGNCGPCTTCECPFFCPPETADEIVWAGYEEALADGEPWAEEAYEYRQGKR